MSRYTDKELRDLIYLADNGFTISENIELIREVQKSRANELIYKELIEAYEQRIKVLRALGIDDSMREVTRAYRKRLEID